MPDEAIHVPVGLTTDGLLGRRYIARGIDSTIILILISVVSLLATLVAGPHLNTLLSLPTVLILWIGYGTLLESSPWQATLGKRFMGMRVYNSQGGRMTLLQAASRNLVKDGPFLIFQIGLFPGAQYVGMVWLAAHLVVLHRSPVYQAIHDHVTHTWVAAPESTIQLRLTVE